MLRTWTYTNPRGEQINLNEPPYAIINYSGTGIPNMGVQSNLVINRPGVNVKNVQIPQRELVLQIYCETEDAYNKLLALIPSTFGLSDLQLGTLVYKNSSGEVKSLRCSAYSGMNVNFSSLRANATQFALSIRFVAPRPFWYNAVKQEQQLTVFPPVRFTFPLHFPIDLGSERSEVSLEPNYKGSAVTNSLEWLVFGPCKAPYIENRSIERVFSLNEDFVVPTGRFLKVNFGWSPEHSDRITVVIIDSLGNEDNIISQMEGSSRPLYLVPGNNDLAMGQLEGASVIHHLSWYEEFLTS